MNNIRIEVGTTFNRASLNKETVTIPSEWEVKTLGDIGQIVTGNTPPKSNELFWNSKDVPWLTTPDIKANTKFLHNFSTYVSFDGAKKSRTVPAGSILVSCIATIGEVGITYVESAFNQQINAVIPYNTSVDFLYFLLKHQKPALAKYADSSVVAIISKRRFLEFEVCIPKSLAEQSLIATVLSKQESVVHKLTLLVERLGERNAYFMGELLSGRLQLISKSNKISIVGGTDFANTKLNGMPVKAPNGWHVKKVREIASINRSSIDTKITLNKTVFEYYDIDSVVNGPKTIIAEELPSRAKRSAEKGDILLSTVRPNLKNVMFLESSRKNSVFSTGFAVLSATDADSKYLYYVLSSQVFTEYLESISARAVFPSFNSKDLADAELLVASSSEQVLISQMLTKLDAERSAYLKLLDKEKQRFDYLLNELMSGRLRVVAE